MLSSLPSVRLTWVRTVCHTQRGPPRVCATAWTSARAAAGIIGGGRVNGGANDPPGHLVASYDEATNFLMPAMLNITGCTGFSCRPKLVVFRLCTSVVVDGARNLTRKRPGAW